MQFLNSLRGQPPTLFSAGELRYEPLVPRVWYWKGLGDISSSAVESGSWYTSIQQSTRLKYLVNAFAAVRHPVCFVVFVLVALCRVKVRATELYWTKFQSIAIFRNPFKHHGFSPSDPPFLQQSLLSHRPLICYHTPTQLSD